MERTPQHRNRYTSPAQPRGRDFRSYRPISPQAPIPNAQPAAINQSPHQQQYQQPVQMQPPPVDYMQPAETYAAPVAQVQQFDPATTQPATNQPHGHMPIQYPAYSAPVQPIVAAPAPPPPAESPAPQPQPHQLPGLQQGHALSPQSHHVSQTVTPPPQQHFNPYQPDENSEHWEPLHVTPDHPDAAPPLKGISGKINTTLSNLKSYYSASPKRAAFIAGSSLLVLSVIGWTLAMQSSSANDLLAKTPFGFLLIKQGHTKGDQTMIIEEKPTSEDIANHKTLPNNPRYMTIQKLNLFARALSLESKGEGIELPENIYDVGWSTQSNPPTDAQGTQLYIGHAKGITKTDAAFSRLSELKEGDEIQVETGDGQLFTYVVMHTEKANVSSPNISRYYNSWVIGKPGLNLLTTSGVDPTQENPSENRYATFAVFSVLK